MTTVPTQHFAQRAFERGLATDVEDFILTWGHEIESRDDAFCITVVQRDLPGDVRWSRVARRAEGWVLVVATCGAILTCYRLRNAFKVLRRRRDERARRSSQFATFSPPKVGEKPI